MWYKEETVKMMPWNRKEVWMGSDEQFFSKMKECRKGILFLKST